jgi:S-adenosylmethionine:tRNA ribosyltransferase-isomerase
VTPARAPRPRGSERLLHVDPRGGFESLAIAALPELFRPGDLLVVNDAATLPASFRIADSGAELRLIGHGARDGEWRALLFGAGDFRMPTESRPEPPRVAVGQRLALGANFAALVSAVDPSAPRLVEVRFSESGAALWQALYRHGRPIQYAYVPEPLELWDVQNAFAARPWAFEAPSASRPLGFELLVALRRRGVRVTALTHAAGISSTGSAELDARLPLAERYEIPAAAVQDILETRAAGGRVVAAGTTVVRALESSARRHGELRSGAGQAKLLIGPGFRLRVTDGILSGLHAPGTSHFALLEAFVRRELLQRALEHAAELGYLEHEFGDACLILARDRGASALTRIE